MTDLFPSPYDKVNKDYQNIVYSLLKYFETTGCKACIAGGCIRDWRINNNINDIDFFISLKNDKFPNLTWTNSQYRREINALLRAAPFPGWEKVYAKTKIKNKLGDALIKAADEVYDKELFVYETKISSLNLLPIEPIKLQLIFVPLKKYTDIDQFIDKTFDFDINKGRAKLYDDKIKFQDDLLVAELERATITFNLSNLIEDNWRLTRVPERSARFQDKLSNFNIRIV